MHLHDLLVSRRNRAIEALAKSCLAGVEDLPFTDLCHIVDVVIDAVDEHDEVYTVTRDVRDLADDVHEVYEYGSAEPSIYVDCRVPSVTVRA